MKKILLLSALSFAFAACGTLPAQVVTLPAPATLVTARPFVLTTEAAQLLAANVHVTWGEGQALIVAPTGSAATVRIRDQVQVLTGPFAVRPSSGLVIEAQVKGEFVRVASLR